MIWCCRAPTDCVQWHTGTTGNVYSYNHAGSQLLSGQIYTNCIRTEKGGTSVCIQIFHLV